MIARLAALALLLVASAAHAWPEKPVRFIVPAPPGGAMDVMARVISAQLSQRARQPVIVEPRPGGGGGIAVQAVLNGDADGHTLLFTGSTVLAEIPHVLRVPYNPLTDLRPLADFGRSHVVLVAHPAVPATSLKELVGHARRMSGKLAYASYGEGTAAHYAGLILNRREGIELQHVPYRGSPPALADLVAGHVPLMFDGLVTSLPHLRAGRIKAFAISSPKRSPLLPQVPTFAELGYPEIDFVNWSGVVASARMAPALAQTIHSELVAVLAAPAARERLAELGFELAPAATPEELAARLRQDYERHARLVQMFSTAQ